MPAAARRDLHMRNWSTTRLADAVAMVADLRRRFDATLSTVDDEVLRVVQPGDARPAWANVTFSWLEATHHCDEVGVLRDLYRTRASV
jgi:hypothetical protein